MNDATSRLIILINGESNEANCMLRNSAKLDRRTKQHTQSGVSTSDGSRDMARTKSWRKKKRKKKKKEKKMNACNPIKRSLRGSLLISLLQNQPKGFIFNELWYTGLHVYTKNYLNE